MVFPNFFITFVRHSFHTSHPCTSPSRERRHRPAPPYHQAPHSLMAHALPHALSARDCLTRCTSQGLCHAALPPSMKATLLHAPTPSVLPPRKGYATCAAHTLRILALTAPTPPQRAMPRTLLLMRLKRPSHYTPSTFWEESASPITTKILHITILHVTFTRIGVKTTQKSEAIFSFID